MSEDNKNKNTDPRKDMFSVPENYFEYSRAGIFNALGYQEELKDFPLLSKIKNQTGFIVPQNYFSKQTDLELYPALFVAGKNLPMVVPENYFQENQGGIQKLFGFPGIAASELMFVKENPFSVGDGYFTQNASKIQDSLLSEKTKVIPLYKKRTALSAAAVLIITLGIGMYQVYFKPEQINECVTIACIEKQVLLKTKNLESMENDELYELVNPDELIKKLEKKETGPGQQNTDSSNNTLLQDYYDEI